MPLDDTLLNLNHTPTLSELKDYYHKHDWSAAQLSDTEMCNEVQKAEVAEVKQYLDPVFEQVSRKMGMKSGSVYYHKEDNPLMVLRNNVENLVSDSVTQIVNEPETALAILEQYDLDDEEKAEAFLHTAVETMLTVMDYEKMIEAVANFSDERDFAKTSHANFREMDHNRRWNHTDAKTKVVFVSDYSQLVNRPDSPADIEQIVIQRETAQEYIDSLSETDRRILKMLSDGYSQSEIASSLNFANNGAVSKRVSKMRNTLRRMLE